MDIEFNRNEDQMKQLIEKMNRRLTKIHLGGGEKAAAKQKAKGKMLARERVAYLIDKDSDFFEIGAFAAEDMYEEYGGCPAAGVVAGIGRVSGRLCVLVSNDATVKAGGLVPDGG